MFTQKANALYMFSMDMFLTHCDLSLFQLTGLFQFTVRLLSEMEARFTSVERINHYIKVNVQTDRKIMFSIGIGCSILEQHSNQRPSARYTPRTHCGETSQPGLGGYLHAYDFPHLTTFSYKQNSTTSRKMLYLIFSMYSTKLWSNGIKYPVYRCLGKQLTQQLLFNDSAIRL